MKRLNLRRAFPAHVPTHVTHGWTNMRAGDALYRFLTEDTQRKKKQIMIADRTLTPRVYARGRILNLGDVFFDSSNGLSGNPEHALRILTQTPANVQALAKHPLIVLLAARKHVEVRVADTMPDMDFILRGSGSFIKIQDARRDAGKFCERARGTEAQDFVEGLYETYDQAWTNATPLEAHL